MTRSRPLMTLLIAVNVFLTVWPIGPVITLIVKNIGHKVYHPYTYIGTDFPPQHPSLPHKPASLTLQESVRYGVNGSDLVTSKEWDSLQKHPHGLGRAILGPEHREFLVTFYHQLHCIREIQKGLFNRDDSEATPHHMKHCLDYLRQTMLCSAVDTLEEGDFLKRNLEIQRTGGDLVCWDWELVYNGLDDGWLEFTEWRTNWNESLH